MTGRASIFDRSVPAISGAMISSKACPRFRVVSRELSQCFFGCLIAEAFQSCVIVIMNEAVEEGVTIVMGGEQPVGAAALSLSSYGLGDAAVEALGHAVGLGPIWLGEPVLDAGLGAGLIEGMLAGGLAFGFAFHACPREGGDPRRSGR